MPVEVSETSFPNNVVLLLKQELQKIDPPDGDYPGIFVTTRPIRKGDPVQAIGITAALWTPDEDSEEILGPDQRTGATINHYLIGIQTFIQHMGEEEGLQLAATLAGIVRTQLSMSLPLRVALGALQSIEFGYKESFKRGTVQGQRFLSNEIEGSFYHLSNLEYIVETEISNV